MADNRQEDHAEKASEFLLGLLERMGISADIDIQEHDDKVVLDIQTSDSEFLCARRGVIIDALQHLVHKVIYKERSTEKGKAIIVDTGGYRGRQSERLQQLAQRMAEKALANNEIIPLSPMSPHDRRIVHMAVSTMQGLTTRSEGEGDERHILLIPAALA